MKHRTSFCRLTALGALAAGLCIGANPQGARAAEKPSAAEALIYSTMPSTTAHRPEMTMDGDPSSYYKSTYGMDDGDDFLVLLSHPISVNSLKIVTGDADGVDLLTDGFVETSPDGVTYTKAASFDNAGVASASLGGKSVIAVKIRLNPHAGIPSLLIREISLDSPSKITHVAIGPGRGFVDTSQAPDVADWAARAEKQLESFWSDTAALLYTDGFITPNMVNIVYRTGPGVTDVAATGGGVMTVNAKWCREHPDDTGLTVHETAHVVQAMAGYDPVWLIEGTADYIRWVKFEPQNFHPRINVQKSTYHDAYQTSATFLAWCELHYDRGLVTKLNRATRYGNYKNDMFKQYCGKDVDTLWAEFIEDYKKDPINIITPPVAPADRPRTLPVVKAGTSVAVDLSSAFDVQGIAKDGSSFPANEGTDGGGAAYSASLLGTSQTWKDVKFTIGPPNAPDIVSAKGNVIAAPAGTYSSIWLLGTAVDGNKVAQTFTVTYSDGSTQELAQNLSDWFKPQGYAGENRAVKTVYRNLGDGTKDPRPFFVYSYGFSLDAGKTVKSITLPNSPSVKLLAITLAN